MEVLSQQKLNQGAFHTMHNTDLALTKQITSAFNGLYLEGIERRHVKFLGVPSLDIIQHLCNNYGTLNQLYIDDDDKKMNKHYNPTLLIEVLFDQIEESMEVAEAESCSYKKIKIYKKHTYPFSKQVSTNKTSFNGTARPWKISYGQSSRHISPKHIVKTVTSTKQRHR